MKSGLFLIGLLSFTINAFAEEVKGIDYCHDAKVSQEWLKMITDYPHDPVILKLAGLREGLCLMIDRKQISHEQGTDIWEDERQRSIIDRDKEQSQKIPKFTI